MIEYILYSYIMLTLLPIASWSAALYYVQQLETQQCECSKQDWKRNAIKICTFVLILISIANLIFHPQLAKEGMMKYVYICAGLFSIFTSILIFVYIRKLRSSVDCECAKSTTQTVVQWLNYTQLTIMALSIFASFLFVGYAIGSSSVKNKRR